MRVTATVQARMGSSRLPGKVLRSICDRPMLAHQIERISRARLVDEIIVATTTAPADTAIVDLAQQVGVGVFQGSEDDVLGRICRLIERHSVDVHVELIGDSPLSDPQIIDEIIGFFLKYRNDYDYVSNGMKVTYPSGIEVNVYLGETLLAVERSVAGDDPLREHVDIHLSRNVDYRRRNLPAPPWFYRPEIFLEVDTALDFQMISSIFGHFFERGVTHFGLGQILDFLDSRPDLIALNQQVERRWRQFKDQD